MYIYTSGAVGEAVRQKIESTKNSIVNGGKADSTSFSEVIKSMLQTVDGASVKDAEEATAVSQQTSEKQLDGSALLYALQNSDNYSVGGLISAYSGSGLKTPAAELQTAARKLLDGVTPETASAFTEKYNALVNALTASGSSSSLIYLNALETYVTAASDKLAAAGISTERGYTLSYSADGAAGEAPELSELVGSVTSTATQIYSSVSSDGTGSYYQSLISSMLGG